LAVPLFVKISKSISTPVSSDGGLLMPATRVRDLLLPVNVYLKLFTPDEGGESERLALKRGGPHTIKKCGKRGRNV